MNIWVKHLPGRGNSKGKGTEIKRDLIYPRNIMDPNVRGERGGTEVGEWARAGLCRNM